MRKTDIMNESGEKVIIRKITSGRLCCIFIFILITSLLWSCDDMKRMKADEDIEFCELIMISADSDFAVQVCRYKVSYEDKKGKAYEAYEYWTNLYINTISGLKRVKSILTEESRGTKHVTSPAFSFKGSRFVAFILGGSLYMYDITAESKEKDLQEATIEVSKRTLIEHDSSGKRLSGIKAVAFQPNADIMAINTESGIAFFKRESNVWKELFQSKKIYRKIPFISSDDYSIKGARDIAFTPQGEYLVVLDQSGAINFYTVGTDGDYVNLQLIKSTEGNSEAASLVILSDAKNVVLFSDDLQRAWVYDLWQGRFITTASFNKEGIHNGSFWGNKSYGWVGITNWEDRVVAIIRNSENDKPMFTIPDSVNAVDYDFNSNRLVVWYKNNPEFFSYVPEGRLFK